MAHNIKTLEAASGMKRNIKNKEYMSIALGSKRDLNEFLLFFHENIGSYRMIPLTHSYLDNPDATHTLYIRPINKEIITTARALIKKLWE